MKRLLIVDDDSRVLRATARAMGRLLGDGWEIHQAAVPEIAVYIASRQSYRREDRERTNYNPGEIDVVLSDYQMPGYDGLDVLAEFAKHSPSTLRLLTSGLPMEEIANKDDRAETVVDFYLPKPLDPHLLADMLEGE